MRLQSSPRVLYGLRPNARPEYDRFSVKKYEDNAIEGSAKLRKAIAAYHVERGRPQWRALL